MRVRESFKMMAARTFANKYNFCALVKSYQHNPSIRIVTLSNEKKRNALSLEFLNQLRQAILEFNDLQTKVIIIKAQGPVFSAGHDLKEIESLNPDQNLILFQTLAKICQDIRILPQPVIAQVNGLATAGGCQLALACDMITASSKAQFATPGLKVGLFCTTPGIELVRALPSLKIAMQMLLTAEPINSAEAYRLGLINLVCETDQLDQETLKLAEKITQFSGESIALGIQQNNNQNIQFFRKKCIISIILDVRYKQSI